MPLKIEVFRFRRRMSRREDKFRNFDENRTQRKAAFEDRIVKRLLSGFAANSSVNAGGVSTGILVFRC